METAVIQVLVHSLQMRIEVGNHGLEDGCYCINHISHIRSLPESLCVVIRAIYPSLYGSVVEGCGFRQTSLYTGQDCDDPPCLVGDDLAVLRQHHGHQEQNR